MNWIKNIFTIKPRDEVEIADIKKRFDHKKRSFVYLGIKFLVDSLDFEASPGVAETVILKLLDFKKTRGKDNKHRLLNIGGGSGQQSKLYESLGFDVYSLDIRNNSSDEKNKYFDLNEDTILPFQENTFDVIVCQEVIEHIENPWKLLRDSKKLMKNNGILIVTTPNILSVQSRLMFLISGYFKWFTPADFDYHINPISKWELFNISSKIGLSLSTIKGNGDYFINRKNKKILALSETMKY